MIPESRPCPRWLRKLACGALLLVALPGCAPAVEYEFPACEPGSSGIEVLAVPRSYGVSGERRIDRGVPLGDPGRVTFFRTYLFTTYPDFEPFATASSERQGRTRAAIGDESVAGAWVIHGDGNQFYRARDTLPAERSPDGQYWVHPDRALRSGRPSHDGMNHFVPTDRPDVLIMCKDRGDNSLPAAGDRCIVQSRITQPARFACLTVGFRIAAEDLAQWRTLDERLQRKVKGMIRPGAR